MIGLVKIVTALAMLVTVQDTRPPPLADQLDEAMRIQAASVGSRLHMELNGCMKDGRNSAAVTCYYTLAKTIPLEAHADAPKSPVQRVVVELPAGKDNVGTIVLTAVILADLLIPALPPTQRQTFKKKVADDLAGPFAEGSANLGPYDFNYQATDKKATLKIFSR